MKYSSTVVSFCILFKSIKRITIKTYTNHDKCVEYITYSQEQVYRYVVETILVTRRQGTKIDQLCQLQWTKIILIVNICIIPQSLRDWLLQPYNELCLTAVTAAHTNNDTLIYIHAGGFTSQLDSSQDNKLLS